MVGSNLQSIDMREQNAIGGFTYLFYLFYYDWLVGGFNLIIDILTIFLQHILGGKMLLILI